MICQELSSLAEQKCNAVVFVLSNDAYAIEQAFVDITAFQPEGEFAPFDLPRPGTIPPWRRPSERRATGCGPSASWRAC
jgi:indolepyruvate decarboxylase